MELLVVTYSKGIALFLNGLHDFKNGISWVVRIAMFKKFPGSDLMGLHVSIVNRKWKCLAMPVFACFW